MVRKIAENYKLPYYTMSPTYSICKEHGYLAGEHFKCPHCGANAEVYSRITGYYRPVQNWNDGKSQEYKNRKLYDVIDFKTRPIAPKKVTITEQDVTISEEDSIKYLFTTKTCPNCALAKEALKDEDYILIDAGENIELARKYKVMQAPTLVVVKDQKVEKYVNISSILQYVEEKAQAKVENLVTQ